MKFKFTVIFFAAVLFLCSCGVMSGGRDREEKLNTDTDPFKGLEVSFHGEPEKGFADMDVSKCDSFIRDNFKFECKNDGRLSNGETVQVIVSVKSRDAQDSGVNILHLLQTTKLQRTFLQQIALIYKYIAFQLQQVF